MSQADKKRSILLGNRILAINQDKLDGLWYLEWRTPEGKLIRRISHSQTAFWRSVYHNYCVRVGKYFGA